MVRSTRAPTTVPTIPPEPPLKAVPPITAADMEIMTKSAPAVGEPLATWAVRKSPANAANAPDRP